MMFQDFQSFLLYTIKNVVFQGRQPDENLDGSHARCSALCLFTQMRRQNAGRQPANTHMSKDTRKAANFSYTALAACRVTLAGAAEMGAYGRHAMLDPIYFRGWATRKRELR